MTKHARPLIVACIPAYNEEKSIAKVVMRTHEFVDKVVVCDDGSTDMTAKIAEKLGAIVIRHEKNKGYGASIKSLFAKCRELNVDVMVTVDGDGQHDPTQITYLIEPIIQNEADIVIGSRFLDGNNHKKIPKYRQAGIKVITKVAGKVSFNGISDAQCGFRAYSRRAIHEIYVGEYGMGVSTEILVKAKDCNLRIKEIPVNVNYEGDTSKENPMMHGIDVLLGTIKFASLRHSLLFYGLPGLICLSVAAFFWIWTFDIFANTRQVITNIALIAIGSTVVGLMLVTTAILLYTIITVVRER